jgi:hypothetical protein
MPPAASPWTFLVPALGAFLGVVLAQWWTTRREKRQWERQMQMYATQWADQRERDAQQREDQRRRDREQWDREDRHRFTEDKRSLYGDLLGLAVEAQNVISDIEGTHIFGLEPEVGPDGLDSYRQRLTISTGKIDLVAPADICEHAMSVRVAFILAASRLRRWLDDETDDRKREFNAQEAELRGAIETLREAMRQDLAVDFHRDSSETPSA